MLSLLFFCLCFQVEPLLGPQDLSAFQGMDRWPLYEAGGLQLADIESGPLHATYAAKFPDGSPLSGKYIDTTMVLSLFPVHFQTEPAYWIQWTSSGSATATNGAPAVDFIVAKASNHQILARFAGTPGKREWMGAQQWTQFMPNQVVKVDLAEDGTSTVRKWPTEKRYWDFSTFPFLLPRLPLQKGLSFRYQAYQYQTGLDITPAVYVAGKIPFVDGNGVEHMVWDVWVTNPGEVIFCRFYISESPPYFLGWDYRLAKDGRLISSMRYLSRTGKGL